MSDKDIFDEFEKSIDDAFNEKERIKNKSGYMFNDAYDQFLREKWKRERERGVYINDVYINDNSYVVNDRLKCFKCKNLLELRILVKDEPVRYHSILSRPIYEDRNLYFCPICASSFATKGKLVKINVEVRQEWR